MTTIERPPSMPKREWFLSEHDSGYEEAARDARESGEELLTVPSFEVTWEGPQQGIGGYITDFEAHFPMVDWQELKTWLDEARLDVTEFWFAHISQDETGRFALGAPDARALLIHAGNGALRLKSETANKAMPYLSSTVPTPPAADQD
ncbi:MULTISPECIES: hypothetical protein [unclassified Streptomyces]|uniref:hypothetical protein n=1 Tax=unclassified Streptomyces TaxID=2593676 RepID=UPI003659F935